MSQLGKEQGSPPAGRGAEHLGGAGAEESGAFVEWLLGRAAKASCGHLVPRRSLDPFSLCHLGLVAQWDLGGCVLMGLIFGCWSQPGGKLKL